MDKKLTQLQNILDLLPRLIVVLDNNHKIVMQNGTMDYELPRDLSHIIKSFMGSNRTGWIMIPTPTHKRLGFLAPFEDYSILFLPDSFPGMDKTATDAVSYIENDSDPPAGATEMSYTSDTMKETSDLISKAAKVDANVLFLGETGTGKTYFSKYIHNNSARKKGPFVAINCGAIPATLLEAELFGYEKGAFTGASTTGKAGLLEAGIGGTVLLDEIGELPKELQVKLLTAIDEKKIIRIGGRESLDLDIRIIAATNKDLLKMVREGNFREDLFYRLNIISILIPPLRDRKEDITSLTNLFLSDFNLKYNVSKIIDDRVLRSFHKYRWPGNIRELQNIVERMVVISENNTIYYGDLPPHFLMAKPHASFEDEEDVTLQSQKDALERNLIEKALSENKSIRKAASSLGISHVTLLRKMEKWRTEDKS